LSTLVVAPCRPGTGILFFYSLIRKEEEKELGFNNIRNAPTAQEEYKNQEYGLVQRVILTLFRLVTFV